MQPLRSSSACPAERCRRTSPNQYNYPLVSFIEIFHKFEHALLTTSAGAEAVAIFLELGLKDRREDLDDGLLECLVNHRGDAKLAHSVIWFGYFYPSHGCGLIASLKD